MKKIIFLMVGYTAISISATAQSAEGQSQPSSEPTLIPVTSSAEEDFVKFTWASQQDRFESNESLIQTADLLIILGAFESVYNIKADINRDNKINYLDIAGLLYLFEQQSKLLED